MSDCGLFRLLYARFYLYTKFCFVCVFGIVYLLGFVYAFDVCVMCLSSRKTGGSCFGVYGVIVLCIVYYCFSVHYRVYSFVC